jgi:competence ComEA-like helix-hairpin-helix protein
MVFGILFVLRGRDSKPEKDYSYLDREMDSLSAKKKVSKTNFSFKNFDPNVVTIPEMVAMGIRVKDAKTLLKYRKYNPFSKPEDLKKLYFMKEDFYSKLEPYIRIESKVIAVNSKDQSTNYSKPKENYKAVKPDINAADTTALKKVYGIGSYLAKQIVWYRNKLGWFENIEQLKEVKGMRTEAYERIKDKVVLGKVVPEKLNLNVATWKEIIRHPYINKEQTNKIVRYKKEFGTILTLEELVIIEVFTKAEEKKLGPYLVFLILD